MNLDELEIKFMKNFVEPNSKYGPYHFLNTKDLLRFFIQIFYKDSAVAFIPDCKQAFNIIPKLNILKRDDFTVYEKSGIFDHVLIEFPDLKKAEDWCFSLPIKNQLNWEIYLNGKLYRNEKGLIKNEDK
jgi:hypothetical protein